MVVTSYASESRFPCIDLEFLNIIAYSWLLHSSQLSGDIRLKTYGKYWNSPTSSNYGFYNRLTAFFILQIALIRWPSGNSNVSFAVSEAWRTHLWAFSIQPWGKIWFYRENRRILSLAVKTEIWGKLGETGKNCLFWRFTQIAKNILSSFGKFSY